MRGRPRRKWRPLPPPIQILLDAADDLRVLRALEAFAAPRRGAIVVRPTPGCAGLRTLHHNLLDAAGLPVTCQLGQSARSSYERTVTRLRRARVGEIFVLRAHTVGRGRWVHLGRVAAEIGARLMLIVHATYTCPDNLEFLRWSGLRVATPRELRLTTDVRALALGIPPLESWPLNPTLPVFWLPAVPVRSSAGSSVLSVHARASMKPGPIHY